MTDEREERVLRLHLEEVFQAGPDAEPMPTLYYANGAAYFDPEHSQPFEPTFEQWKAAGYRRRRRWVSEWEDVP